jgi:hypothetical protein
MQGSKLVMDIEVDGKPKEIKWMKDGRPLDEDLGAKAEDLGNGKYRLTIPELRDDKDFGNYSVKVSNDAGSAESSAKITEKGKIFTCFIITKIIIRHFKKLFLHQSEMMGYNLVLVALISFLLFCSVLFS